MDIYYSDRRGGFLSQPVNLGPNINTPGNEVFPFVDSKGRLFFASDGLPGLGGLDLFVGLSMPQGFSNPHNLGPGINSAYDDFSIVWDEDSRAGYFASNRPGGQGNDDIYAFKALKPLTFTHIKGLITNSTTGEPEEAVTISVFKQGNIPVAAFESDEEGVFSPEALFEMIKGRKTEKKEGSYTTYLFEKGIDKILKKVGEECTEVIIASKDNDKKETIYEIADLYYHVMVMMVEMGIDVDDVLKELASRHVIDKKVKQEKMTS